MIQGSPVVTKQQQAQAGQVSVQGKTTFQYLYVPANTVAGEVLIRAYDGDEETNPKAIAAATSTVLQRKAIATEAQGTSAGFQWCVIEGECEALVDGTTDVAKDDFLEVLNTASSFVKDGTSRAATSAAIARAARTTDSAGLLAIYLIGEGSTVAAS